MPLLFNSQLMATGTKGDKDKLTKKQKQMRKANIKRGATLLTEYGGMKRKKKAKQTAEKAYYGSGAEADVASNLITRASVKRAKSDFGRDKAPRR